MQQREGEGGEVGRSHGRQALLVYGEESELYSKFHRKSLEKCKQRDVISF